MRRLDKSCPVIETKACAGQSELLQFGQSGEGLLGVSTWKCRRKKGAFPTSGADFNTHAVSGISASLASASSVNYILI